MRRLLALLPLLLFLSARPAHAQLANAQGWCESGATVVISSGLQSTNQVQGSFPSCTVSVSIHGGGTATIYSTGSMTPLSNPFTAQTNGRWLFYAANGEYDITMTGGGLTSPVTYSDVWITNVTSGGSGGTPCVTTANSIQYNNAGAFGCMAGATTPDAGNSIDIKGPVPWADIVKFGARPVSSIPQTTATCNGTTAVTLATASTFQNGDGITLLGCGATISLSTPSAPSVTPSIAVTGTGEGGGNTVKSVVNSGTGASTYAYEVIYRDQVGGLTAPSSATTIANGLSAIGPTTCTVTTATRSNASVTIDFSATCAGAIQFARFQLTGASIGDFDGWYNVTTVNSSTEVVVTNTGIDSRGIGWLNGDSASSSGGTATFILSNHIQMTWQSNMWEAYLCGERPGDSSFKLIGVTKPSVNGGFRDLQFDDYGSPYNDSQTYPSYVTNSNCNGGSALNDPLTTTISSGAGTVNIVVANAASNSSSGLLATFDDGPALLAAANAQAGIGGVFIPPTVITNGFYPIYSFTTLPASTMILQAGNLRLYETLQLNTHTWVGEWTASGTPQFGTQNFAQTNIIAANPGIYINHPGLISKIGMNTNFTNGGTGIVDDSPGAGDNFEYFNLGMNTSTSDYLSMGVVMRMLDPAGEQRYTFTHAVFTSALPTTPLSTPFIFVPPDQDGTGALKNAQDGHFIFSDTSWGVRGSEYEECTGNTDWNYVGPTVRQGGGAPLLSAGNCSSSGNLYLHIQNSVQDTDTSGVLNLINAGGIFTLIVDFNNVNMASTQAGSNGPPPPIQGDLQTITTRAYSGISGKIPNVSGVGTCPSNGNAANTIYCDYMPTLFSNPNGYIYWPLSAPTSPTASLVAGGSIASETLQFAVSAVDSIGKETIISILSSSVTTSGTCPSSGNCSVSVGATAPAGAASFNIYECGQSSVCPSMRLTRSGVTSLPITLTTIGAGVGPLAATVGGVSGLNSATGWSLQYSFVEGTAPTCTTNLDQIFGIASGHRLSFCNNGGSVDQVVGAATTDTLTHKTYDTAGTGNVLKINGNQVSAVTGNTSSVQLQSGATTTGDAVKFDANGNTVDSGFAGTLIICTGQIALSTGAISSGTRATNTLSCTGLSATTDSITCTFSGDTNAVTGYAPSASGGLSLKTWVSTNTINVDQVNDTGGSITPGAATVNCKGVR